MGARSGGGSRYRVHTAGEASPSRCRSSPTHRRFSCSPRSLPAAPVCAKAISSRVRPHPLARPRADARPATEDPGTGSSSSRRSSVAIGKSAPPSPAGRADLAKARLELRKGPLRRNRPSQGRNKTRDPAGHVESLDKSGRAHEASAAADLKILELQRDRQKAALERAQANAQRSRPVAAAGHGRAGCDLAPGPESARPSPGGRSARAGPVAVKVFASPRWRCRFPVAGRWGAMLAPGTRAEVRLDAYPEVAFALSIPRVPWLPAAMAAPGPLRRAFGWRAAIAGCSRISRPPWMSS